MFQNSDQLTSLSELYSKLEGWRRKQVAEITEKYHGVEQRQALINLLDHETQLLRQLEEHRALRSSRKRNIALNSFLNEVNYVFYAIVILPIYCLLDTISSILTDLRDYMCQ